MESQLAWQSYCGRYTAFGLMLEVAIIEGQLTAAMAGVPVGFEIILQSTSDPRAFRMIGGPLSNARVEFRLQDDGSPATAQVGEFVLEQISSEKAESIEVTERLFLPAITWSEEKTTAFESLLDALLERNDGGFIVYELPYPKYEFLHFIAGKNRFIFHGSNNMEIERFEPIRKSFELRDASGRGNLPAVYGTHDGIWPMFFAIVARGQLKGSIRNGVMYFQSRGGEELAVYNFSINREMLPERPYCDGAVYLLPRDTFRRLKMGDEAWSNEWASEQPVDPIARLALKPEDFPFLEQIGGHDDSMMVRHGELLKIVLAAVIEAQPLDDGYNLTLRWNVENAAAVHEFLQLQREIDSVGEYHLAESPDGESAQLTMHLPPALQHVLKNALEKSLPDST